MLPGIEGANVVAVVVEEMKQDLLLSEELQQALVEVHLAKDVKLRGILHRDILPLALTILEGEGVLMSLEFSTGEDVKRLFHRKHSTFSNSLTLPLRGIEDCQPYQFIIPVAQENAVFPHLRRGCFLRPLETNIEHVCLSIIVHPQLRGGES